MVRPPTMPYRAPPKMAARKGPRGAQDIQHDGCTAGFLSLPLLVDQSGNPMHIIREARHTQTYCTVDDNGSLADQGVMGWRE